MRSVNGSVCPGYEQLRSMPGILRALLAGLAEDECRWKPSAGRWSVMEVLGHLAHVEALGFRERVLRMWREDNPRLESYDPDRYAAAGAYEQPTVAVALDAFARERGRSLTMLRALPADAAARAGVHAELGAVTIGALVNEWPFHDLGHLRQIAELVRAVKFYPHMGAWQKFYNVAP